METMEAKHANRRNKVYIATSLDGYIAEPDGGIGFLESFPDPVDEDMGFHGFMAEVDALLMGRKTYETVIGFGVEWPYTIPVFVWSSTLKSPKPGLEDKVRMVEGDVHSVLSQIHSLGHASLYVDGGRAIQSLLREDLIDEMTLSTIPILIGSGIPLFAAQEGRPKFFCTDCRRFSNGIVQSRFERMRDVG